FNTIIQLAKNLGIAVIAEGAETIEQVNFLKENRCDTVQGFYYHKPMQAVEVEQVLRQNLKTPG
ncbi:MAG TPA: GGDEF domain-containing response regulator, partial [Acetobacterium sp.]|nr:GGDEF domain-containing response regulator [Acetobacterium sp.]